MDGLIRRAIAAWLLVSLFGCTCAIAGCASDYAQADCGPSRFSISMAYEDGDIDLFVLTDTETGTSWLYARDTSFGRTAIDVEPLEGVEDGAVSD